MNNLNTLVAQAQAGDLDAWREIVLATQHMAYAAAFRILHNIDLAQDAAQDAYLRAFRRLPSLHEPAAFLNWLRRIVITVSMDLRRANRTTLLRLDDTPILPILDDDEPAWSAEQRRLLANALLSLTPVERRLCDRRYHGRWTIARLAIDAGVDQSAMRKRLQRIRDKLRKEMEMNEQHGLNPEDLPHNFPATIVELLARPTLTDLPENPVGIILDQLRNIHPDCTELPLPEILDTAELTKIIGRNSPYFALPDLCRLDQHRILRSDLTLPLLMNLRFQGHPLRVWAAGKVYRTGRPDSTHLEAFHQAEFFWLEERQNLDRGAITGKVHQSVESLLPGRPIKIIPTAFPLCTQTWELEVEQDGHWMELLAWGFYTDDVVRRLGADPLRHTAVGVGYGLERIAMLRFAIDDIRKIDIMRFAETTPH